MVHKLHFKKFRDVYYALQLTKGGYIERKGKITKYPDWLWVLKNKNTAGAFIRYFDANSIRLDQAIEEFIKETQC